MVVGTTWAIAYWVASVNSERRALRKDIDVDRNTIKGFMDEIRSDIKKIFERLPPTPMLVKSDSPISLTDLGEQAAKEMDVYAWASSVAPDLLDQVAGKQEFEIYEFCSEYIHSLKDEEMLRKVAACAYNHGTDSGSVLTVLMVVLRDKLLELLGLNEAD